MSLLLSSSFRFLEGGGSPLVDEMIGDVRSVCV